MKDPLDVPQEPQRDRVKGWPWLRCPVAVYQACRVGGCCSELGAVSELRPTPRLAEADLRIRADGWGPTGGLSHGPLAAPWSPLGAFLTMSVPGCWRHCFGGAAQA